MYNYTWRSPLLSSPLADSALFPIAPLSTPLLLTWNPPSCDRIRPPRSQVACKLTSPVLTLSPTPPPSSFPEPQLPSASLRRPQDQSGVFYPEQVYLMKYFWVKKTAFRLFLSQTVWETACFWHRFRAAGGLFASFKSLHHHPCPSAWLAPADYCRSMTTSHPLWGSHIWLPAAGLHTFFTAIRFRFK